MGKRHISTEYAPNGYNENQVTRCGAIHKDIWDITNDSLFTAGCKKCIDSYYKEHPSADSTKNPYFKPIKRDLR